MYFGKAILFLISAVAATSLPAPQAIFSDTDEKDDAASYRIPTIQESAVQARRILRLENIGTLSTIFPSEKGKYDRRPEETNGLPVGLMDYFADCEGYGDPTILAINIATAFRNVAAGSNITLSLRWHPPNKKPFSAAAIPRFSLIGHLEDITAEEVIKKNIAGCFVKSHPDSIAWLPGNPIHESQFVRLVVEDVYWIGGFGDRAYIGWIPTETWRNVTEKEIGAIKLPGEEKKWPWQDWSMSWEL